MKSGKKYFLLWFFILMWSQLAPLGIAGSAKSLCKKDEFALFSCRAKSKVFSLCSSRDLSATAGYIQYRVEKEGHLEMIFPKDLKHPRGIFKAEVAARGVGVTFNSAGSEYSLSSVSGPNGGDSIRVTKGKAHSDFDCVRTDPSSGLDWTNNMNVMKAGAILPPP